MAYPASLDTFTSVSGTSKLSSPDHAVAHNTIGTALAGLEVAVGTTTGTNVFKDISVGKFAAPTAGGTLTTTTISSGTISGVLVGTSTITGGTISGATMTSHMAYSDTRLKVGVITHDLATASGTVAYTSVGFQPKSIIFLAAVPSTNGASWGVDDGTTAKNFYDDLRIADSYNVDSSTQSICLQSSADASSYYTGKVSSFDSDGFSLAWTKVGTPTGTVTVAYLAFR